MGVQQNVGSGFESLHRNTPPDRFHKGVELGTRMPLIGRRGVIALGVGSSLEPGIRALLVLGHDRKLGALHVQGVGGDDAAIPHLFAQQASKHFLRQGGRHRRVQGLNDDVGCHDHVHFRADRHAEGHQVTLQGSATVLHDRKTKMGVDLGITMTWEMLGGGRNPSGLNAANLLDAEYPDAHRIVPHGPHPDYGIGWVSVDVNVRGEVHVNAQGSQLATEHRALGTRSARVIDSTQRHIPWKFGGRGGNPRDDTALLIDSDGQRRRRRRPRRLLQAVGKVGDGGRIRGRRDVTGPVEVQHPAKVVLLHGLGRSADVIAKGQLILPRH